MITFKEVAIFYVGADCVFEGRPCTLNSVQYNDDNKPESVFLSFSDGGLDFNIYYDFSGLKPILRSSSSMTKQELDLWDSFIDVFSIEGTSDLIEGEAKRTVWLFKNYFDPFNLIPTGQAIDKEEYLKQTI